MKQTVCTMLYKFKSSYSENNEAISVFRILKIFFPFKLLVIHSTELLMFSKNNLPKINLIANSCLEAIHVL